MRSRPQRNSFHRFTVDRHLIEAVVQASRLTREVGRPDLLLVGALLHDLGKGYPGDHTKAGVALVDDVAPRLGFRPEDVSVLATLVREHLLLASVATSRDLSDPVTIDTVARAVGDREVLALLAALTKADSLATGEAVWSTWKEELIDDLVRRVDAALRGDALPSTVGEFDDARRALTERASASCSSRSTARASRWSRPTGPACSPAIVGPARAPRSERAERGRDHGPRRHHGGQLHGPPGVRSVAGPGPRCGRSSSRSWTGRST